MQASSSPQPASEPDTLLEQCLAFANQRLPDMKKVAQNGNSVKFHECCFTFSTKKMRPQLGHPTHEAVTLRRLLEQHHIESEEEFAGLLHRLSTARTDSTAGQVPTWNQRHREQLDLGKREVRPADPDPAAEVEQLRRQLAAEQNYVLELEERNRDLVEQLRLERTAAAQHERRYLSTVYCLETAKSYLAMDDTRLPWVVTQSIGDRLAVGFQAAHPERPTFGNIPRPHHPEYSDSTLSVDPDYAELTRLLMKYARKMAPDNVRN